MIIIWNTLIADRLKIVGGERAPAEYPYQISLQIRMPVYIAFWQTSTDGWAHNCGGSIVTTRHVVTAAHCLRGYNSSALSVLAGTTKLNSGEGQRFMVDSFIIHPDYVELNTSDIGIMTTSTPFVFGPNVSNVTK